MMPDFLITVTQYAAEETVELAVTADNYEEAKDAAVEEARLNADKYFGSEPSYYFDVDSADDSEDQSLLEEGHDHSIHIVVP
jgi:hypothetical protein